MKTIHLILNAHIDPVWLWSWPAGLDAVLNTGRTMCDLLEAHPAAIFTQGDAWTYFEIEEVDPHLFHRISALIRSGRWHVTGGWWIQPDCNFPSAEGLRHQIQLGLRYFQDRFDRAPRVGFNVDSFGHPATLPTLMRACGQDRYVMMRPGEQEMALPARVFRWSEREGTPEVLTFRIADAYATFDDDLERHLGFALTELPEGIEHTMCFVGVGDHGGGPTVRQLQWLDAHPELEGGWRLEYSTPDRFFDAIEKSRSLLPVVTGELQPHAIGCYSVGREIKQAVRRAERMLDAAARISNDLDDPWRDLCFAHFHDTLAGTAIPSAYPQILDRIGRAAACADEICQRELRRTAAELPSSPLARLILFNPGVRIFDGFVEHQVSMLEERRPWPPWWRLLNDQGGEIPYQIVAPEAAVTPSLMTGLLIPATLTSGEITILSIDRRRLTPPSPLSSWRGGSQNHETSCNSKGFTVPPLQEERGLGGEEQDRKNDQDPASGSDRPPGVAATATTLRASEGPTVCLGEAPRMELPGLNLPLPQLHLLPDHSDTWSHEVERYAEGPTPKTTWSAPRILEAGPLRASLIQKGKVGTIRVQRELLLYAGCSFVELRLRVEWTARHRVLKLVIEPPAPIADRLDGIPGGWISRPLSGVERPLRGWTMLILEGGMKMGVVCPSIFALDGNERRIRLTLLRSPLMAHHRPQHASASPRAAFADRGDHEFHLRFTAGSGLSPGDLEDLAWSMENPPFVAECTAGMYGEG